MLQEIEQTLRSHPFITPRLFQNTNIQTLGSTFIPSFTIATPTQERKLIKLFDGTQLAADCIWQKERKKHTTIVLLNGFDGYLKSTPSNLVRGLGMKAYYFGYNVISLKQRGEADTIHLTKSLYTSYDGIEDIPTALEAFNTWGLSNFYLVGSSYGAYLCLLTLGRLAKKAKQNISGAVAISPHVSFLNTWEHIKKNRFYDFWLLSAYKQLVRRRAKIDHPDKWDVKGLRKIKTKREFVEKYKHTFGYPKKDFTLEEFNQEGDVSLLFSQIHIPTLIINSYDDPISPTEPYTKSDIQNNPHIITLLTKHGGHGGFFTTKKLYGDLDGHWAQNRAMEFIKLLEKRSK